MVKTHPTGHVPGLGTPRRDGPRHSTTAAFTLDVSLRALAPVNAIPRPSPPALSLIRPEADIGRHLGFSAARCLFSVISLLLVLTDIPRTGLSLRLGKFYPSLGNGLVMFWGPYDYPVQHINISGPGGGYEGFHRGRRISAAGLWPYKYDTLSIVSRGLAEHLNVSAYPPCVLYRGECPSATLDLGTAFTMLDQLVSALQRRYFVTPDVEHRPVVLFTRSNWTDRLHHMIVRLWWRRQDYRLHMIHHLRYDPRASPHGVGLCGSPFRGTTAARNTTTRAIRSFICTTPVPWRCKDPTVAAGDGGLHPTLPLWEHLDARLRVLQRQYPGLSLDLTILNTRARHASRVRALIPKVNVATENFEITTIIRGRACTASPNATTADQCETRFVDDYRYERGISESDEDDWYRVTTLLRGLAQGYVWLRVGLLWWGCYAARSAEPGFRGAPLARRLRRTVGTFFRIPSYVIVYGSWLPIACYAIAHYMDSNVIHLVGEYDWASVNGSFQFDLLRFVRVATIQMRNIWFIALLWRVLPLVGAKCLAPRQWAWHPRDGLVGNRGMLIGLTSWLTIFSFLRALRFRDTRILVVKVLSRESTSFLDRATFENPTEYGYIFDTKVAISASACLGLGLAALQGLLRLTTGVGVNFFACRSYYIPLSAGALWPRSGLGIFWFVHRRRRHQPPQQHQLPQQQQQQQRLQLALRNCPVCRPQPWYLSWPPVHGCRRHEQITCVDKRPPEIWALVRLMNIAFMSDPLVLAGLYATGGRLLYVYRLPGSMAALFLLPRRIDDDDDDDDDDDGGDHTSLVPVGATTSAALPWHVLVNVG